MTRHNYDIFSSPFFLTVGLLVFKTKNLCTILRGFPPTRRIKLRTLGYWKPLDGVDVGLDRLAGTVRQRESVCVCGRRVEEKGERTGGM
jgi:hypothetical protein